MSMTILNVLTKNNVLPSGSNNDSRNTKNILKIQEHEQFKPWLKIALKGPWRYLLKFSKLKIEKIQGVNMGG